MSSFTKSLLSAERADLAFEKRNLKVFKRFLNSPETSPTEKEFLEQLVYDREFRIQNCQKHLKHYARQRT